MSRMFNGLTSALTCPALVISSAAQPLTLCAWVALTGTGRINTASRSQGGIVGKFNPSGNLINYGLYQTNDSLGFMKLGGDPSLRRVTSAGALRTDGTWQHVAVTWTGAETDTSVRLYVDAVEPSYLVSQSGATGTDDESTPLCIGNNPALLLGVSGWVAYVHFFRSILSPDQIRQVRDYPASILSTGSQTSLGTGGLIGYWSLQAGAPGPTSTTFFEHDFSGNSQTMVGTTASLLELQMNPPVNRVPMEVGDSGSWS